ncbi:Nitrogenase component 1 type Oxidoreductase [Salipiger thiooxidans]|uniref:Nitrogenase component 1 type Oxidoreductase n=1 Tax=Salipiger thiooxidans TaxID=282683 RepID=A0A1G7HPZ1_9RHOB|nr:Nitrogenase component 1 type Oxidoreductase [Salipiger thiooxidans]
MAAEMGSVEDLELEDVLKVGYRPRLEGKSVMLYVGGLRPRHVVTAYDDFGMVIAGTGYEFGHNDDYKRTGHYVKDGTLIYDDVAGYELEKFIEKIRPDLVGSGIKEKYPVQKMGIPFRQMHSWDYSGPYHGYDGFAIFARDMDLAINNPVRGMYDAPWDKPETGPAIAAECPLPPGAPAPVSSGGPMSSSHHRRVSECGRPREGLQPCLSRQTRCSITHRSSSNPNTRTCWPTRK